MIAVIAVLSFVMAFGAIWFTTEALKRVDNFNDAKMRPHLTKINQAVKGVNENMRTLNGRMELLEKQVHTLQLKADIPQVIMQKASALHLDLLKAQQNIPTVRLNG
jgi:hypothetical protein